MKPCRCGEYHASYLGCGEWTPPQMKEHAGPEQIGRLCGDAFFDSHAAYASMQLLIEVLGNETFCIHDADLILLRSEHR